jgi:hypothetical protein
MPSNNNSPFLNINQIQNSSSVFFTNNEKPYNPFSNKVDNTNFFS